MKIGGFQKTSLIDYPGKIAAVVYTQGCNFRCPFCHNPELVCPEFFKTCFDEQEIFSLLKKRTGRLEGVVITGGEPMLQPDIADFMRKIKAMGFKLKLDTNGCFPEALEKVLKEKLADFVAMDIKAPLPQYHQMAGTEVNVEKIRESIGLIKTLAPDYEFRTTIVKNMLNKHDIVEIIQAIEPAKKYVVQRFRSESEILDESIKNFVYTDSEFHEKKLFLKEYGLQTEVYFR